MPYTYIITYIPNNVKYYGVQYGKHSDPKNLGITYFSSSKTVNELIRTEGLENFTFEVRKIFEDKTKALDWERRFLTKVKAAQSPMWFNLRNGSGINIGGYSLSIVTRQKMSGPKGSAHKQKLKNHLDNKRKIPEWTDERKKFHSERMKGHKINTGRKMPKWTDERKKACSERLIGNKNGSGQHIIKIVKCPYCGVEGGGGNMTRYHFNKCKKAPITQSLYD